MDPKTSTVRPLRTNPQSVIPVWLAIGILVASGLIGGFSGWALSAKSSAKSETPSQSVVTSKSSGIKDTKRFPDAAMGILKEGGIDGEGSYHLERPGGKSQNVYLTSSIVDLAKFVGKKIKVQGETFSGQTAGWLMDVGYVELQ
ncbi:MAG: hypothetical protein WBC38_01695 [Microgenomates group bacterium]|jgi:hypothetical protein